MPVDDDARSAPVGEEDDDGLDTAAAVMLQDLLDRTAAGVGPSTALRAAVDAWLGDSPPPAAWAATRANDIALRRLAKRLVSDLVQQKEAA